MSCDRCGWDGKTERYGQDDLCGPCALEASCRMAEDVIAHNADFAGVAVPDRPEYLLGLIWAAAHFDPDIRNSKARAIIRPQR